MFIIKRRIEGVVREAFETQCDRQNLYGIFPFNDYFDRFTFWSFSKIMKIHIFTHLTLWKDEKSRRNIAMKRASKHVCSAYDGMDIISQCQLESVHRRSGVLSLLFRMRNHYLWTVFMHLVVISHVALSFYESKNKRTDDYWTIFGRRYSVGVTFHVQFTHNLK